MFSYPIVLDLKDKKVVVIGMGHVADEKIKELELAEAEIVQISTDEYSKEDLKGAWLVVVATKDLNLNAEISKAATEMGIWINVADDPKNCTAILPARIRRGSLLIAISTNGLSPAFSSWLRRRLEREIGSEFEDLLNIVADVRKEMQKTNRSLESLDWQTTLDLAVEEVVDLIKQGNLKEAKGILQKCLS